MRLRFWVLILADLMVIMHITYLCCIVGDQQDPELLKWMFSKNVPPAIYITVNIMPIVLSTFLYVGIFKLSTKLLFMWLFTMVLLWHIPAILIFHILCVDSDRKLESSLTKQRILAPSLWLCIWMLVMINVFTFYSELKKFKKHPQFLRTNVVLVKKMTEFVKLKASQPGKMLVSVDSEM